MSLRAVTSPGEESLLLRSSLAAVRPRGPWVCCVAPGGLAALSTPPLAGQEPEAMKERGTMQEVEEMQEADKMWDVEEM